MQSSTGTLTADHMNQQQQPRSKTSVATQRRNLNIQNMSQIVRSVRADITHLRTQLESTIPQIPEG